MKNTTISEQELLFRSVYDTYQKAVYRIAYSILHDEGAAEDTVQLTFLKLYHELDRIGEVHSGKARAFVIVLARNTAIDQYRKRRREQTVYFEDLANVPQSSDSSPEQLVIDRQSEEQIAQLLGAMDEKYRTILLLRFCHGYRNKEIAAQLGMSEPAVAARIFQAKKLLCRNFSVA
ncbi:MAG: RNA polymerase sigma factor [Angelakisella sp.]